MPIKPTLRLPLPFVREIRMPARRQMALLALPYFANLRYIVREVRRDRWRNLRTAFVASGNVLDRLARLLFLPRLDRFLLDPHKPRNDRLELRGHPPAKAAVVTIEAVTEQRQVRMRAITPGARRIKAQTH